MAGFVAPLGLELKYSRSLDIISKEERSRDPNLMTRDLLGEEKSPGGQVFSSYNGLSIVRPLGLSMLVIFCSWTIVLAPLMSV